MVCAAAIHASNDPLCLTARNGSVTVKFVIKNVTPSTIQYSTNLTTWNTCSDTTMVTLNANKKVYFRAAADQTTASAVEFGSFDDSYSSCFTFSGVGTVEASGNIMSLYGPSCPDIALSSYAFAYMFYDCTSLTTAPELPATTLALRCYEGMFRGCTSLTTVPVLPATTLTSFCYLGMFFDCSSLKVNIAPPGKKWRINATSIGTSALQHMFSGTGGTMNDTPSANTTYYTSLTPKDSTCHDTICFGESFTNYGFNIDASNIHSGDNTFTRTITAISDDNPDTLITLYLNALATHHEISEIICSGEVYNFAGQSLTTSGDYQNIVSTSYGCLDTTILHLTVSETYDNYENITICQGETYTCGGNQYGESGDYTITLVSKEGCDSTVHLHLIVIDIPIGVDNAEMSGVSVYGENNKIVVAGAEGHELRVYDAVGRLLAIKESADEMESVEVESAGIYFVTFDNGANVRIMVR